MAARRAWVLNLDADLELAAARRGAPRYAPTRSVLVAMQPHVERLAASLLAPGDVRVDEASAGGAARGLPGRAFCPTPRALAALRRAGAEPEPHPSVDVLCTVNSRAFAAALGPTVPGAAFVSDMTAALARLRSDPEIGDAWRLKRPYGMAGRGQRVVARGAVDEAVLGFVRRGIAEGGVQIEPDVRIAEEYALHGMLDAGGALQLGVPVRQTCDPRGVWRSTEPLARAETGSDLVERLTSEARRVAAALAAAGYFGPFGIDAYTYTDRRGATLLQPRSEINARYTMGFALGFGLAETHD